LVIVALGLPEVVVELGADLLEKIVKATAAVDRGCAPHTTMRIHRHGGV